MTRYTFGGDEQILAIFSDEMSLKACFRGFHLADVIRSRKIAGITEICAGNVALMLRFDPDIIAPDILMNELEQLDSTLSAEEGSFETRVIEVPVLYGDPWTHETLMRFRDRHQNPELTDLSYAAAINGYPNVAAFIKAHTSAPWITSMVGFVAGLPFLYQMVEQEQQIQVPKYLRPRTDTPALSIGHGGCFGSIYPVRGAGGYQ
ncbi:allophanate hydrolase subunit 1, partial [Komagataeibacter sp. FXV3]|uniref:5-oxoprolinase subunit B family protein n=1 Tax=Komagataeibacter sp. FXV3 TaxID=2608998 RepID=UPI00187BAAF9